MLIEQLNAEQVTLTLTQEELTLFNNALNETREALDDDDLRIRVGTTLEKLEQLLHLVHTALEKMRSSAS